ncbi:glutathione-disulfide reductase [Halopseudomonas pachastrellae]|uniref:Glutathione-disulfide reductase n=1 Tax=Halopseudomonas pachastrellae TaxID=254161 RepID=A0A1S8DK25_9GAMM|nr:glutathione-disulfide reductase [Halopseudomonas pachastrellae]ONM44970.1 glutathione-disulfide reductase [Halopseudomonas pachastrellae]WVM88561.1 glutathione-disulfide reductase [Halopseudomonas pachastrellae]SFM19799.1 glutathione reductase (NADPH) [Halopseudomonas pachastrellae]
MSQYDFDLFVIGAGSGGVRASRMAAGFGARVAVAEDRYLGGTCVNVGCVPKKLFAYAAHFAEDMEDAAGYGWNLTADGFDWPRLVANKNAEISRLNGIYRNLLTSAGVKLLEGRARILDSHHVEVSGQKYSAERILIATGGWPFIPEFPGREHVISSNEVFFLEQLPKRVMVVGGGYIAIEFAGIFHGLGCETTQLYRGDLFLRGFDQGVREHMANVLRDKGLDLRFNSDVARIDRNNDGSLKVQLDNGEQLETDLVLYATGRRPHVDDLGLENTAVELDDKGNIRVNEHYQTTDSAIFAIGDVTDTVELTPVALAEGMALARWLYKRDEYRPVDYNDIPTAVFCIPNIATLGLSEEAARKKGHKLKIFESRFRAMRNTLAGRGEQSFMKLIVDQQSDQVLGVHMVGPEAGEIVQGLAVAVKAGATKAVFDATLGIHPTAAEEFVTMRSPTRED